MVDPDNELELLAIDIDIDISADDYASTATGDLPVDAESRTFQSEEDFLAQKAIYRAKIDGGKAVEELGVAVPVLDLRFTNVGDGGFVNGDGGAVNGGGGGGGGGHEGGEKVVLTKKQIQLLGYAVAELYFHEDLEGVRTLCERVLQRCRVEGKVAEGLERWMRRCDQGMQGQGG